MLSALLGDNLLASGDEIVSSVLNYASRNDSMGGLLIGGGGAGLSEGAAGGLASLSGQSEQERAYAPFPSTTGELIHDPDFSLPTIAGSLAWRMFYYSAHPYIDGPFGYGRRASWPLRGCVHQDPIDGSVVTVSLEREDGLGAVYVSQDGSATYQAITPRIFDSLYGSPTAGFTEVRLDTGTSFVYDAAYSDELKHPPTCAITTLSYYQTAHGEMVNLNYDSGNGRLNSIEDPAGREIAYTYYPDETGDPNFTNGRVQAVTDWASRVHTFTYDDGNLLAIEDPGGYFTTYGYDCYRHLKRIEDPNGFVTTFAYDDRDRVTMRNVDNRVGRYQYGGDPSSGQTVFYYPPADASDPLHPVSPPMWQTTTDVQGNVTSVVDPLGAERRARYNHYGQPLALTDAVGRVTTMQYDAVWPPVAGMTGRQTLHQEPGQLPNSFTYDAWGNLLTHEDPLGRVTTYTYGDGVATVSPQQRLQQTAEDPLGRVTSYTYRPWGGLHSVETPLGMFTTYTWDDTNGVMTAEENPLGGSRLYGYDAAGNRTSATDEMGRRMDFTFDGLGRQTSSQNGVGAVRTSVWDGVGNLVAHVDPFGFATTYQYDALRNETVEVDAYGFRFTTIYDLKGRETARQDANGNQTQSVWDVADRRTERIDGVGHITTTLYDLARRVVGLKDSAGNVYQTTYSGSDAAGLSVVAQVSPTGHRTTSVYDAAGQLAATIDSVGHRTSYVYDRAGRLWSTQESTGARTTTTYDASGRSVEVVNALGYRATSTYDVAGHLTQSIDPVGRIYTTSYDLSGLRLQEQAPDGTWVQRHYDAAGRNDSTLDYRGYTTYTTYDLADRVTAFMDEYGKVVQDVYSPIGLVSMSYDTLGNISTTIYDAGRRPTLYLDGAGNVATTQYDPANKVSLYLAGLDTSEAYHYDGFGRYQATETPLGERTSIAYDPFGRLAAQMDATSNATSLSYDGFGRWAATMDPTGAVVTTNFDVYGRPCGYTDELGYVTTFAMDLLDRPIAQIDALGFATSYVFDAVGRTVGRQDAQGARSTSVYDGRGNLRATMNALGQLTTFGYDAYSRRISTENALGFVSTTVYDNYGRFWASEDARGNLSTTTYDPWSRFWSSENALGQRTTTVYDYYGRTWASIDPLGYRTTTGYDALSRVTGRMDADGFITTTVYDPVGRPWATMDPLGYRTSTAYDAAGRVLGTMDALGFISTNVFDGVGRTVANVDARGYRTSYVYDLKGQQVASMDALGFVHSTVYDALGRSVASVDPLGYRTTMFYDSVGRVSARQDQLGYLTSSTYDILGRTVATTDALNRLTTFAFDAAGRTVATQDAAGVFMTTTYDPVGNRLAWQNGLGYLTSYSYDALNRKVAWMDPLGRSHTLSFDAAGRLATETDALGQVTTHGYDPNGWETARSFADGQAFSFSYDHRGAMLTAFDSTGLTTSTYDAVGRLRSVLGPDYPGSMPLTYSYDGMGNRTKLAGYFADGSGGYSGVFTYTYDERGQLATLADPGYPSQSIASGITTFGYDALGRTSFQQNGNATGSTFAYDPVGRTLQIWHSSLSSGSPIDRAFYGFDAAGRPLFLDTAAVRHTYTYDAVDQLASEQVSYPSSGLVLGGGPPPPPNVQWTTYTYDAAGRRTVQSISPSNAYPAGRVLTSTYDAADQLGSLQDMDGTVTAFGYDANGARITTDLTAPPPDGDSVRLSANTWDAAGRLHTVKQGLFTPVTMTYGWDGLRHALVATPPSGFSNLPTGREAYLWDPATGQPLSWQGQGGTVDGLSQVFSQKPTGGESDSALLRASGNTIGFGSTDALDLGYLADGQGSIQETVSGNISALNTQRLPVRDAFGNALTGQVIFLPGPSSNPLEWHGGLGYWQEGDLALTYVRQRWLDNETGQWMSVDPVDGEPRYSYAHNSPTLWTDASGTQIGSVQSSGLIPPGNNSTEAQKLIQLAHIIFDRGKQALSSVHVPAWCVSYLNMQRAYTEAPNQLFEQLGAWDNRHWKSFVESGANDYAALQRASGIRIDFVSITPIHFPGSMWGAFVTSMPLEIQPLYPPATDSPDFLRWSGGVIYGVYDFIKGTLQQALTAVAEVTTPLTTALGPVFGPLAVGAPKGIELFVACVGFLNRVLQYNWHNSWHDFGVLLQRGFANLRHLNALSWYDKGSLWGKLAANVVAAVWLIGDILRLVGAEEAATLLEKYVPRFHISVKDFRGNSWLARLLRAFGFAEDSPEANGVNKPRKPKAAPAQRAEAESKARQLARIENAQDGVPSGGVATNTELAADELASKIGVNLKNLDVIIMKNSEAPPGVKLSAEKEAGFGYDYYGTKKRYIVFKDDFAEGSIGYDKSVLAAHEIGHAELFARLSRELGGDDAAYELGTRTYQSNYEYKAREEAYVQRLAMERIAPLFPNVSSAELKAQEIYLKGWERAIKYSNGGVYGPIPRDLYGRVPFLPTSPRSHGKLLCEERQYHVILEIPLGTLACYGCRQKLRLGYGSTDCRANS